MNRLPFFCVFFVLALLAGPIEAQTTERVEVAALAVSKQPMRERQAFAGFLPAFDDWSVRRAHVEASSFAGFSYAPDLKTDAAPTIAYAPLTGWIALLAPHRMALDPHADESAERRFPSPAAHNPYQEFLRDWDPLKKPLDAGDILKRYAFPGLDARIQVGVWGYGGRVGMSVPLTTIGKWFE